MAARPISARLVQAYLQAWPSLSVLGPRLRDRARRRGPHLTFFHDVCDVHSAVVAAWLQAALADPDVRGAVGPITIVIVPRPGRALDPEPALRHAWAFRDAAAWGRAWGLRDSASQAVGASASGPDAIELAARIALVERSTSSRLSLLCALSRALLHQPAELAALAAKHGAVPASRVLSALSHGEARLTRAGLVRGGAVLFRGVRFPGPGRLADLATELGEIVGREVAPRFAPEDVGPDELVGGAARPATSGPLELYFSFRSPYSYLALERTLELARRSEREVQLKPVLPMVMRGLPVPRRKRLAIVHDAARQARRLGIPFGRIVDPVGRGVERCLAVCGASSAEEAKAFAVAAGRAIWSEGVDVATDDGLAHCAAQAGLPADLVLARAEKPEGLAAAARHREELLAMGLWGVPTFRCGAFTAWGQDRLWMVERLLA